MLSEVADEQSGLLPARPPESITVADVLQVVRTSNNTGAGSDNAHGDEPVEKLLGELYAAARTSSANMRFSEVVKTIDPPPSKATR